MSAIETPVFDIPIPTSNLEIFWLLLGMQFGRSFGKKLDQGIQSGTWFNKLKDWEKGIVKRILDFFHHWWVGGLLWLYATDIALRLGLSHHVIAITFFGVGLLLDDIRDIDNLKRRYGVSDEVE